MSQRNWMSYAPIGVSLAIVAMLAIAGAIERNQQGSCGYHSPNQQTTDAPYRVACAGVPEIPGIKTPPPKAEPTREEWREESDLEAQWRTAEWTRNATGVALFGCVLTVIGIWFVRETLKANLAAVEQARRSVDIVEAASQLELRAYLKAQLFIENYQLALPDVDPEEFTALTLRVVVTNVGNTPASNVSVELVINIVQLVTDDLNEPMQNLGPETRQRFVGLVPQHGAESIDVTTLFSRSSGTEHVDENWMSVLCDLTLRYDDEFTLRDKEKARRTLNTRFHGPLGLEELLALSGSTRAD